MEAWGPLAGTNCLCSSLFSFPLQVTDHWPQLPLWFWAWCHERLASLPSCAWLHVHSHDTSGLRFSVCFTVSPRVFKPTRVHLPCICHLLLPISALFRLPLAHLHLPRPAFHISDGTPPTRGGPTWCHSQCQRSGCWKLLCSLSIHGG